jgi:hypothetical protein
MDDYADFVPQIIRMPLSLKKKIKKNQTIDVCRGNKKSILLLVLILLSSNFFSIWKKVLVRVNLLYSLQDSNATEYANNYNENKAGIQRIMMSPF